MKLKEKLFRLLPFLSVFSLIFGRYLYYGPVYFYQLDDYIQYHNYTAFNPSIWKLIKDMGLLQARPAAGVLDLAVWSRMFPVMILAVAVISALYAGAALLLRAVFRRHFDTGWFFIVIFALLPLGFEGTYWVSASSRIVCGLFFAALAAWLMQKYFDGGPWPLLPAALAVQFFASCFYEQVLVFSVALMLLLAVLSFRERGKRCFWGLFALVNTGLYFLLTALAPSGTFYESRMELVLPNTLYYFDTFLPEVLGQLRHAFLGGGFYTLAKGLWRGIRILLADRAFWFALFALALCVLFYFVARRREKESGQKRKRGWIALLCGILLALAPLAPFFILANPWFSLRGTVTSFAGIALAADALLNRLLRPFGCRRQGAAVISAATAFIFVLAGISELHDYRQTMRNDQQIGTLITAEAALENAGESVGILCLEPSYLEEQNYFWHEHLHGVTESNWALTGFLQYLCNEQEIASVTPLPTDPLYRAYNYESNRPDRFDRLYYYNAGEGTLLPVTLKQTGERAYEVYLEDGRQAARIQDENGIGRIIPLL